MTKLKPCSRLKAQPGQALRSGLGQRAAGHRDLAPARPNLYYSTSAFAPKHYPVAVIEYANTRGADKVIYAGYFPMGLSLERIFRDMPGVPFKDEVWPKFLHENASRVLKLDV